jgi:SHS2 domain-containing protein
VEGADLEDLLRRWLEELLERRIIHSIVYSDFAIVSIQRISATQYLLTGSAHGELFDAAKHGALVNPALNAKSVSWQKSGKKFSCTFQARTTK